MNTALASLAPPAAPSAAPFPSAGRELISSITLRAPLLGVGPARLALRCGEGQLMDWILSGDLEWAFDLRRAGARRSCLRILTESIVRLQQRDRLLTPREKAAQRLHPLENVFDAMFQHHKSFLFSTELARVWACSPHHIHNLIQDGLLGRVDKDYVPREAARICRQTAFHFMQTRRIL
ncbi:MAG: hypothetical protein ABSC18_10600 [Verrucomicrobiota bacterium]|jgi:hypothetical protein